MKKAFLLHAILISIGMGSVLSMVQEKYDNEKVYLFSYFKGNGEDGLHLAWSRDGFQWKALNQDRSFLKPEIDSKLMRDPCICRGPDGQFHMAWTTGW